MIKLYYKFKGHAALVLDNGRLPESVTESDDYYPIEFADWAEVGRYAKRASMDKKRGQRWLAGALKEFSKHYTE